MGICSCYADRKKLEIIQIKELKTDDKEINKIIESKNSSKSINQNKIINKKSSIYRSVNDTVDSSKIFNSIINSINNKPKTIPKTNINDDKYKKTLLKKKKIEIMIQ